MEKLDLKILSSLAKVFLDEEPIESKYAGRESILRGETYIFQVAFKTKPGDYDQRLKPIVSVISDVKDCITVRKVVNVPCEMPSNPANKDDNYLKNGKPGLYPDILRELDWERKVDSTNFLWHSIWVEFTPKADTKPGNHDITIQFSEDDGEIIGSAKTSVKLINYTLPKQDLIFTQWFHADCISEYYGVKSLSDRHFELLEKFIKTAADNGINMLLVPVFTPPLDIAEGGQRPTIQLVKIAVQNEKYKFNLEYLDRYIDICLKNGIEYFEISHLFTQWGARAVPKIMAMVDGVEKQIFGWDDSSTGEKYKTFLAEFMPVLTTYLKEKGIASHTYFHISDEPSLEHLEKYKECGNLIKPYLNGFKMYDALSNIDFYNEGLIEVPVPGNNHMEPFLEKDIAERWTYYCTSQGTDVSNRFISMPSARNRIIGTQFYKFNIKGFLHWGYNFWYKQYSLGLINPYQTTDAGLAFQSGDAFSVYPGENGPEESLRLRVFYQAICDLRAMKLLESRKSKQAVMDIIEKNIDPITFKHYPHHEDYIINLRMRINEAIENN